jgi:hypothetical protein
VLLIQPKGSKRNNSKKREKQRSNTHHMELHQERGKKKPPFPPRPKILFLLPTFPPPKPNTKILSLPQDPLLHSPYLPQQTFFFPNPQAIDPRADAITPQQQQQTERKQSAVARNS